MSQENQENQENLAIRHNHEFIAFLVRDQEFCIDIKSIREIRGWHQATRLPHVPDYVIGVMNLRGTILPIVDISRRFEMGETKPNQQNVVIVTQIGERLVGLLVDSVSDIVQVGDDQLRELPEIDSEVAAQFLRQVVVFEERIICEIEIENLFPKEEQDAA